MNKPLPELHFCVCCEEFYPSYFMQGDLCLDCADLLIDEIEAVNRGETYPIEELWNDLESEDQS